MIGNLLIVDDELDVLEGLSELFKIELPEITVFSVNNARKALVLLDTVHFDVVLTDINMPKMNGISMFKKIRESWPMCRVIFLTGYKDFDYLYEINQYKDVIFLLKSETNENLLNAVRKSFQSISEMMRDNETFLLDRKIRNVQQKYLSSEMARKINQDTAIEVEFLSEYVKILNLSIDAPLFVFFFRIDSLDISNRNRVSINKHFNEYSQEYFPRKLRVTIQWVTQNQGLILIQSSDIDITSKDDIYSHYIKATGATMYLQEKLLMSHNESFSIITSIELNYLSQITKIYKKLLSFSYLILSNREQTIIKLEEVINYNNTLSNELFDLQKFLSDFKIAIDTRNKLVFENLIGKLLFFILSSKHINQVQTAYNGTMSIIYSTLIKFNISKRNNNYIFPSFESIQQAEQSILEYSKLVSSLFENKGESERLAEITDRVKEYINSNISSDLSLIKLADICFLNPAYLSRVYKQYTGETISEYISRKRIENSKNQLIKPQLKIKEIGNSVGYITPHSFTRFFKKNVGMTPKEYRERNGINDD
ncbi:response regulator transcription factor [Enterococcus sp. DIV1314a]|uniref:response regulator transcription factor n=1 Tax=Enterococcus sp. DIV1314a TaxID=2774660 RepID=UPI003F27A69F